MMADEHLGHFPCLGTHKFNSTEKLCQHHFANGSIDQVQDYFPWGDLDSHLTKGSLGPPESTTHTGCRSIQPFFPQLMAERPYTLQLAVLSPKIAPSRGASEPPSNTRFLMSYAHSSPQPKLHLDRFSRFCTHDRRVSLYFKMGRPIALKIAPFHGDMAPI